MLNSITQQKVKSYLGNVEKYSPHIYTYASSVSIGKMIGLLHLPPELLDMILQNAAFRELVAWSYTNEYFAVLCLRHWKTTKPGKEDICWAARRGNLKVLRKAVQMMKPIDPRRLRITQHAPFGLYPHGSGPLYNAIYCYEASAGAVIRCLNRARFDFELDDFAGEGTWFRVACDRQNYRVALAMLEALLEPPENLLVHCVEKVTGKGAGGHVPDHLVNEYEAIQERLVAYLVKDGHRLQDVNDRPKELESKTALMLAVCHGAPSMVALLLELGADPNVRAGHDDPHGTTALMHAIRTRNQAAVKLLIDAGADIHQQTDGACAAHQLLAPRAVVDACSGEIWTGLLKAGASVDEFLWLSSHRATTRYTVLEQAVHEAFWGNSRPLDLIRDHARGVDPLVLDRAYGFLMDTLRWRSCAMADVRAALRRTA